MRRRARLDGAPAKQDLVLPHRQAADHDLGVLVVNGVAVRAHKTLPIVVGRDAPLHFAPAGAAETHGSAYLPVAAIEIQQRLAGLARMHRHHLSDEDDVVAAVVTGIHLALEGGKRTVKHG